MRFGIPFTRPFTSPFGAPFPGSRRQTPTDYVAKYSAFNPNDFSLVTGNSVNIWDDKTFKTYGSEEVTNGDFSDGSTDWFLTGGSVNAGELTLNVVSGNFSSAVQGKTFTEGTKYIVTVRLKGSNLNAGFRPTDNQGGTGGLKGADNRTQITTDYKDFEFVFTANSNSTVIAIERDTSFGTDFNIVVDSVSLKEVLTGANDITQGTSANQPSLIQNANPALNKVEFDADDFMEGLPPQAGDFTYVLRGLDYDNTGIIRFLTESDLLVERFYFQQNSGGQWVCKDDGGGFHIITTPILAYSEIALKKEGAVLSLHGDGALVGNFSGDVTGDTFNILRLGNALNSINGSIQGLEVFDRALSDQEIKSYGGA
jgi:hypothetical protein